MPEPERLRLYGETEYRAKSWKGLDTRVIYKAEVNQKGDNPRFIVTSIKEASPKVIYEELYCPRGQDENFIKHLKSDLSGDRLSDQGFGKPPEIVLCLCGLRFALRVESQGPERLRAGESPAINSDYKAL